MDFILKISNEFEFQIKNAVSGVAIIFRPMTLDLQNFIESINCKKLKRKQNYDNFKNSFTHNQDARWERG